MRPSDILGRIIAYGLLLSAASVAWSRIELWEMESEVWIGRNVEQSNWTGEQVRDRLDRALEIEPEWPPEGSPPELVAIAAMRRAERELYLEQARRWLRASEENERRFLVE